MSTRIRLIGDVGGTNARFALAVGGTYGCRTRYSTAQHSSIETVIESFLTGLPADLQPDEAAIAVAAPVQGDDIRLTNAGWRFSGTALARRFGFRGLTLLNDFAAIGMAVPYLTAAETEQIGGGNARSGAPIGLVGPGTGLGIGGLLRCPGGAFVALAGEGGHATMAAAEPAEAAILDRIAARFDHVSAERVLSGAGLVNLYEALCAVAGRPAAALTAAEITDEFSTDPLCHAAVARFCAMLGSVAGDLALTLGAEGGIYLAGGIVPRLGVRFAGSAFRRRFEAKGRMQDYLARIPCFIITHPDPALLGLARIPDGGIPDA